LATVASRQRELRIGELRLGGLDRIGVMLPQLGNRSGLSAPECAQQIFRLVLQLIEIGSDGK
jgi:hypothetical protein